MAMVGCTALPEGTTPGGMSAPEALTDVSPPAARPPVYETFPLPAAKVHLVTIPDPGAYPVRVAVADDLTLVPDFEVAPDCRVTDCALAAINAGFFDPNNGLTTSFITVNRVLAADPRQNQSLVGNSALAPYMEQILNRSEFRRYDCEGKPRYDITPHRTSMSPGCALVDAVGAGPQLLPQDTAAIEGFVDTSATPVRDALGSQSANARSAIGIKADGTLVLAMVAQVPGVSPTGMSFAELTDFLAQQGVTRALNLDGGSSSTLVYDGTPHFGRLNPEGEFIQRPVKSIMWVGPTPPE
jgi:hypothetical protein